MLRVMVRSLHLLCLVISFQAYGMESTQIDNTDRLSDTDRKGADVWFDSLDNYLDGQSGMQPPLESIISDIPGPDAWPYIIRFIEEELAGLPDGQAVKKRYVLNMLAALLKENTGEAISLTRNYLDTLKSGEKGDYHDYMLKQVESDLYNVYLKSGDPDLVKKALDGQLDQIKNMGFMERALSFVFDMYLRLFDGGYDLDLDMRTVSVPEILALFGEEDAKNWVDHALRQKGVKLTSESSVVKSFLKRQIIAMGDAVAAPQWQLVDVIGDTSIGLYESIEQHFPNSNSHSAEAYYVFSLVINGQIDKAYQRIEDGFDIAAVDKEIYSSLIDAGKAKEGYKLLKKYVDKNPKTKLVEAFIEVGVAAGEQDEVIGTLQTLRTASGLSGKDRLSVDISYLKAKFAAGAGENRAALLRKLAAQIGSIDSVPEELHEDLYSLAIELMQAGRLFNDQPLYQEAKKLALMFLSRYRNIEDSDIDEMDFIDQLYRNNQLVEAKERLISLAESRVEEDRDPFMYSSNIFAGELLQIYVRLGDYASAMELLDQHPDWNWKTDVKDLVSIQLENDEYLGHVLAETFSYTGRQDEAGKIIRQLIYESPGYDPGYQKYLSMAGPEKAIREFEKVYTLDPFEERPLIWIAQGYLDLKEYDRAMEFLEKAVSIDPSDGEQGKDRRMLVYKLMGEVHLNKGNKEKARFFEDVVTSIRISEQADEFYDAGFTKKSLDMYEEALAYFSDAYCIQSRLAVRQVAFGMEESAFEHYQRAYELMPGSFGRMETHCLACSSVFDRKEAQTLAEEVFGQLMAAQPAKPQTWYMMGYLKKTQKDFTSANVFFGKAASIDPDYINAWKQMKDIEDDIVFSPEEYDDIALNLMRLDPMGRHTYFEDHHIQRVSRLWKDLKANEALVFPEFTDIYTLKAAQARVNNLPEEKRMYMHLVGDKRRVLQPGELLSKHQTISMLSYLSWY